MLSGNIAAADQFYAYFRQNALSCSVALSVVVLAVVFRQTLLVYGKFVYACFLKPVNHGNAAEVQALTGQQRALEGFYRTQASIYDATRGTLLRGREDMLQLTAAQLKHRYRNVDEKPIWVDVSHVSLLSYVEAPTSVAGWRWDRIQHREDELLCFRS